MAASSPAFEFESLSPERSGSLYGREEHMNGIDATESASDEPFVMSQGCLSA